MNKVAVECLINKNIIHCENDCSLVICNFVKTLKLLESGPLFLLQYGLEILIGKKHFSYYQIPYLVLLNPFNYRFKVNTYEQFANNISTINLIELIYGWINIKFSKNGYLRRLWYIKRIYLVTKCIYCT